MASQVSHSFISFLVWTPGADDSQGFMGGHHMVLQISVGCKLQAANPAICHFTFCMVHVKMVWNNATFMLKVYVLKHLRLSGLSSMMSDLLLILL